MCQRDSADPNHITTSASMLQLPPGRVPERLRLQDSQSGQAFWFRLADMTHNKQVWHYEPENGGLKYFGVRLTVFND